ncbi:MAG: YihY/virulence factor BrkB family protein [Sphaerobacteraceae bacterium]|nr:MAG: YihY/virulence factor BrkB family protein [Sphaerobacteraceae bacterium]
MAIPVRALCETSLFWIRSTDERNRLIDRADVWASLVVQLAEADVPKQLPRAYRARLLARAVWRLRGNDVSALAAEAAYFTILAIAPLLLFLIAGIALISQIVPIAMVDDLEQTVARMAPGDTGELLVPLIEEAVNRSDSGMLSFGIISAIVVAMWSGSRAMISLMKGSARISGTEHSPPMIWNRILAIALAGLMGLVLLLSFAVFLFGRGIGRLIAEGMQMGDSFAEIWVYLSWPLMGCIVLLMLCMFYWFAGGRYTDRLRFLSPGAIIVTVLWVAVMLGMRVFLWVIDPVSIYGALGSFVILVVFFYIMSLAFLYGAAINAEVREAHAES